MNFGSLKPSKSQWPKFFPLLKQWSHLVILTRGANLHQSFQKKENAENYPRNVPTWPAEHHHSNRHVRMRETPQDLKSVTVKNAYTRKIRLILSVIPTGDLASKSRLSVGTQRPLSVNLAKLPIQIMSFMLDSLKSPCLPEM